MLNPKTGLQQHGDNQWVYLLLLSELENICYYGFWCYEKLRSPGCMHPGLRNFSFLLMYITDKDVLKSKWNKFVKKMMQVLHDVVVSELRNTVQRIFTQTLGQDGFNLSELMSF